MTHIDILNAMSENHVRTSKGELIFKFYDHQVAQLIKGFIKEKIDKDCISDLNNGFFTLTYENYNLTEWRPIVTELYEVGLKPFKAQNVISSGIKILDNIVKIKSALGPFEALGTDFYGTKADQEKLLVNLLGTDQVLNFSFTCHNKKEYNELIDEICFQLPHLAQYLVNKKFPDALSGKLFLYLVDDKVNNAKVLKTEISDFAVLEKKVKSLYGENVQVTPFEALSLETEIEKHNLEVEKRIQALRNIKI